MRRLIPRAIVAMMAATALAACGDTAISTAPSAAPQRFRAQPPSFDITGTAVPLVQANDTTYATFAVKPDAAETFVFDRHNAISFAAGAVCDPDVSAYGPAEWDQPCVPASREITVSVKVYQARNGHTRVDFQPALRFNPGSDGVLLYIEDNNDGVPLWFKDIYYCNDADVCVDESLADAALETFFDPATGLVARRIKHFSGYNVGVGLSDSGDVY